MFNVLRQVCKSGLGDAEVLGQHFARRACEPIADEERLVFREVAAVEHQQELAAVLQPLYRVGDARGEVP